MNESTIIAIPVVEGQLSSHFGHSDIFALVRVKNDEIISTHFAIPPPHEPGVLPVWVAEQGARVVIAGGMGPKAQSLLAEQGVRVVVGAPTAPPEDLVQQYLLQTLEVGPNVCDHEDTAELSVIPDQELMEQGGAATGKSGSGGTGYFIPPGGSEGP